MRNSSIDNQSKRKSSFSKYFANNVPDTPASPKPILKKKSEGVRPASLGHEPSSGVESI